jgi:hypothetical protein
VLTPNHHVELCSSKAPQYLFYFEDAAEQTYQLFAGLSAAISSVFIVRFFLYTRTKHLSCLLGLSVKQFYTANESISTNGCVMGGSNIWINNATEYLVRPDVCASAILIVLIVV